MPKNGNRNTTTYNAAAEKLISPDNNYNTSTCNTVRKNSDQAREKQKTHKRHFIQRKRLNTAYTEMENIKRRKTQPISEAEQADKITKRKAYMKQLMQKKRADAQFRWKENERKREKAKTNVPNKGNSNSTTFNVAAAKLISSDNNNTSNNKIIDQFHKNIRCGPELICTCCDQLWYRSSVTKCNVNNYSKCPQNNVESCITGVKSVDNTEWICCTCHSNLSNGPRKN